VGNKDQNAVRGAQLLLAGTILQRYCTAGEEDDESEDGSDVIDVRRSAPLAFALVHFSSSQQQATVNGVTRLFPAETQDKDKKKKKRKSAAAEVLQPEGESEPLPIDMLVDTIIGCLEKGTAFLRTVANQSFSLLSARLERSTIELILTVGAIPIP
jgi:DNA polymerase phi